MLFHGIALVLPIIISFNWHVIVGFVGQPGVPISIYGFSMAFAMSVFNKNILKRVLACSAIAFISFFLYGMFEVLIVMIVILLSSFIASGISFKSEVVQNTVYFNFVKSMGFRLARTGIAILCIGVNAFVPFRNEGSEGAIFNCPIAFATISTTTIIVIVLFDCFILTTMEKKETA